MANFNNSITVLSVKFQVKKLLLPDGNSPYADLFAAPVCILSVPKVSQIPS